jgi:hypothetical protein
MTEEKKDEGQKQDDGVKRTRHRSPNYPMIGLRKAVERTTQLHDKYKRASVPIHLVQELWGYKPHSSSGNQSVAAVKAYGLVDVDGDGKARRVRVSDAGHRILGKSPDHKDLLKKAALSPSIHAELWQKYEGEAFPDDSLINHYLVWEREEGTFNPDTVDAFIDNFRDSLHYAALLPGGTIGGEGQAEPAQEKNGNGGQSISAGDFVQRTSGGADPFPEPRRVVGISDDGLWAFVEGSQTGVAMSELSLQKPKSDPPQQTKGDPAQPPPNPFYKPTTPPSGPPPARPGSVQEQKVLDEGTAVMQWPDDLSAESVEDFEYWLKGIVRRLRRKAGLPVDPSKPGDPSSKG